MCIRDRNVPVKLRGVAEDSEVADVYKRQQEAFEQGYRPPYLLYEYLMHKKQPEREVLYTDIAIRTKYNSDLSGVLSPYAEYAESPVQTTA